MLLTCPGCHHTFKHFARENTDKVKCFCGTEVPVDNCVCAAPAPEMLWNPATRKFHG